MFERSDETLIKQALKGKKSAWVQLVRRYEKGIYNYALRMVGHPDDAMDLMQEIFIAVFRNLSSFRGDAKFKNWLYRIAHYRCIEFYRRKRPTQSLDDEPQEVTEESDQQPEQLMHQTQQALALANAMQRLPINQRTVVELKFFQHFTFDEIANQLGVSSNTVKSRLYSALDKLRGVLEVDYV
ncbi:RNA polymerase sigma factor [Thalassotalea mangrovi]|uniref:Sigma-70 family RNA polymerase sigma factor n=1 Tax=Thalassotalea mangrovi TaxID=2572245 RepID=A0A4U1B1T6_9GAMM|nr:sigma-70 family RNA polymerase sigma factor [Thalassotalea mangrovi]TKB43186.1 sigma-70 family RNA polymerase sigma factor [Thalassotalea mangrovi]